MPLGWKRNAPLETAARAFLDSESYVSIKDGVEHDKLAGEDMCQRREQIFFREEGICQECGKFAPLSGIEGYRGAAHHILHKIWERCDCPHNLAWVCGRFVSDCHTKQHVKPMFSSKFPPKEIECSS